MSAARDRCLTNYGDHKVPYESWDQAERACYEMWKQEADDGWRTLFAYLAPCGWYHIGHDGLRTRG